MTVPTKERLALALEAAGFPNIAAEARTGRFSDYETDLAAPKMELVRCLQMARDPRVVFTERVVAGEFDDTREEMLAWKDSPEGRAARRALTEGEG